MKFVDLYVVGGSRGSVREADWMDFFLYIHILVGNLLCAI